MSGIHPTEGKTFTRSGSMNALKIEFPGCKSAPHFSSFSSVRIFCGKVLASQFPRVPRLRASCVPLSRLRSFSTARFCIVLRTECNRSAVGLWQSTKSTRPPDLGLAGLAQFFSGILLFSRGGHVADRFERRKLIACVTRVSLCQLCCLPLSARNPYGLSDYIVLVFLGVVRFLERPCEPPLCSRIGSRRVFSERYCWASSVFSIPTFLGPSWRSCPMPPFVTSASMHWG